MLYRRILRIKAMQMLYAYFQVKKVNYHMALDYIREEFENMLHIRGFRYENQIKREEEKEISFFKENYANSIKKDTYFQISHRAIDIFQENCAKDHLSLSRQVIANGEKIYEYYIEILLLGVRLAQFTHRTRIQHNREIFNILSQNTLIQILSKSILKKKTHSSLINKIYLSQWFRLLCKDEFFCLMLQKTDGSFIKDFQITKYLFQNIIFQTDSILAFFLDEDLFWKEDKVILKNMVLKTIQNGRSSTDICLSLSEFWNKGKKFLENLFNYSIYFLSEYEEIISLKIRGWSLQRLALIDRLILYMAICEMLYFKDIPVKVTIDEYIEIAKKYSTPQSNVFINGIIDVILEYLVKESKIQKNN